MKYYCFRSYQDYLKKGHIYEIKFMNSDYYSIDRYENKDHKFLLSIRWMEYKGHEHLYPNSYRYHGKKLSNKIRIL